jgi:hypothetical protein
VAAAPHGKKQIACPRGHGGHVGFKALNVASGAGEFACGHQVEIGLFGKETATGLRIRPRNIGLGSQCITGNTVWNSTGNHRFGLVTKTARRATRLHSRRRQHWRSKGFATLLKYSPERKACLPYQDAWSQLASARACCLVAQGSGMDDRLWRSASNLAVLLPNPIPGRSMSSNIR